LKQQGGLATPNRTSDAHGEGAFVEIPVEREFALMEVARAFQMFVAMLPGSVRVRMAMIHTGPWIKRRGGLENEAASALKQT
jgi:hypothetical protein